MGHYVIPLIKKMTEKKFGKKPGRGNIMGRFPGQLVWGERRKLPLSHE